MVKCKIGALILAVVVIFSAGYALWTYFQLTPILPWPEEAQLVQVQKVTDEPQQPTVEYEITEELEAELINYFSKVNHRATLEQAGSFAIGDYDYLMVFWSGEEFIQIRLSDEGVTDSQSRLHIIENAPQVLADVEAILKGA